MKAGFEACGGMGIRTLTAISHRVDRVAKRVDFRVEGSLTVEEAKRCAEAVAHELGDKKGIRILIDAREARFLLDFAELEQVAYFTRQLNDVVVRKTAIVVADTLFRDVAEIIIAYSHSVHSPMRMFDDFEKAEAWLDEDLEGVTN